MRQPPEKLASGCCCACLVEAEAGQDRARPRRRGMGADIGEPGLDLGDGVRLDRGARRRAAARRAR